MTITKYRASSGAAYIDAVTVERESSQSVWIRGFTLDAGAGPLLKRPKRSKYDSYFDTWEDAKAFILSEAEAAVTEARLALQAAQGLLGNVKGLKPPKSEAE